jgi:inosine-uridine nucleoside N-ribohydrolase
MDRMPTFPTLSSEFRQQRLGYPAGGKVRLVLDTDTYNEIDDQFAVVYALLAPERLQVDAIYAAPFTNDRSTGPGDGMEKSYAEIQRLLERLNVPSRSLVRRGSTGYLTGRAAPERSPAALDLVEKAMSAPENDPLYVVAIGAITNVASALLIEPEIIRRIVIVWLGGNPVHVPQVHEFNLGQDPRASQVVFDSGVPLVQIPCLGVASHLLTTKVELEDTIAGRNPISDFLYQRFCEYSRDHFAWAKEIWDISTIAYLLDESWVPTTLAPSPVLTTSLTYMPPPPGRHDIRVAWFVRRNAVFKDLFRRLQNI